MRTKLLAVGLGAMAMLAIGGATAHADTSVYVGSNTSVNGTGSGVCASQATQVQVNGQDTVDRNDGACAP